MKHHRLGGILLLKNNVAYGIDLAGYSTGKSQVAKVTRIDSSNDCYLCASIIPTDLLKKYEGKDTLIEAVRADVKVFSNFISNGDVCAVDVPIDLQGLNEFTGNKTFLWETTKRPIDFKLEALPPLASLIGAVVARMQLIMEHFPDALGNTIFETYPAASLSLLNEKRQYKGGKAKWQNGRWDTNGSKSVADQGFSSMLNSMNLICHQEGRILNDDQFDAILSAIPLLAKPWLIGTDLIEHPFLAAEYLTKEPTGYILCGRRFWSRIEVL